MVSEVLTLNIFGKIDGFERVLGDVTGPQSLHPLLPKQLQKNVRFEKGTSQPQSVHTDADNCIIRHVCNFPRCLNVETNI